MKTNILDKIRDYKINEVKERKINFPQNDIIDLIKDDKTIWEREPLESLSNKNQLNAFKHNGFWHPMDTLRDKRHLEDLWIKNKAPWKIWN